MEIGFSKNDLPRTQENFQIVPQSAETDSTINQEGRIPAGVCATTFSPPRKNERKRESRESIDEIKKKKLQREITAIAAIVITRVKLYETFEPASDDTNRAESVLRVSV